MTWAGARGETAAQMAIVLTNAINFLGNWARAFKKTATRPAPFFTTATEKKDVLTMRQEADLRLGAIDGVQVLEMPYVNGALAMDIVLPDALDGLAAVEARLIPAALDEKGTEAAAATAVVVSSDPSAVLPEPAKELKVDHPFLFFLRDTRSRLVLFMGRVANPASP